MAPRQKLIILGGGESGTGAALLGLSKGFDVFLSDKNPIKEHYRNILISNNIPFEDGQHTRETILDANLVIKSPGIPDQNELILELHKKEIPVISEIEFASRYTNANLIAITGSNGKTTTALLTYHLLKSAGLAVGLAGNVGQSFARQVLEEEFDYYVLELSSFQLDNNDLFKADTAILLNITPDHLDRYEYQFDKYVKSKFRIIRNQDETSCFIYNADDLVMNAPENRPSVKAEQLAVSLRNQVSPGAYLANQSLNFKVSDSISFSIALSDIPLKGPHNYLNTMCSVLAATRAGVSPEAIIAGLSTFKNAPHRLEKVTTRQGVDYINDSKATNVDSVYYALQSFDSPIILILGGVDKGNDYDAIKDLVSEKVKGVIALGKDNKKLKTYFGELVPAFFETESLDEAVLKADAWSKPHDVVLLSPACASFDLFKNYEDRGDQFRDIVLKLS